MQHLSVLRTEAVLNTVHYQKQDLGVKQFPVRFDRNRISYK